MKLEADLSSRHVRLKTRLMFDMSAALRGSVSRACVVLSSEHVVISEHRIRTWIIAVPVSVLFLTVGVWTMLPASGVSGWFVPSLLLGMGVLGSVRSVRFLTIRRFIRIDPDGAGDVIRSAFPEGRRVEVFTESRVGISRVVVAGKWDGWVLVVWTHPRRAYGIAASADRESLLAVLHTLPEALGVRVEQEGLPTIRCGL